MALGYACINMTLDSLPKNSKITTNRSMIKKTYASRGYQYASQLALANCQDLYKIVQWNEKQGIKFFRVSSDMFPWASEYQISTLPDYREIRQILENVGAYAHSVGQRLTCHPGPFNKLPSEDPTVIRNTSRDLEIHGEIFDLLTLPQTPYAKINIHVGAAYDDKLRACKTFIKNFNNLSYSVRSRLTVENDDKPALYSTRELHELIYQETGIPIVFDYHHHTFCDGGQSEEEALALASSTWNGIIPVVHYSESRSVEQNDRTIKPQAHSDYVYKYINTHGHVVDIMIEAKEKELALFKYYKLHQDKVTLA